MSKVQLAGNANGTGIFTIASPNSNTDRTINLPDATGTVQVSGNPISGTTGTFTGLLNISAAGAGQIQFPATQNPSSNANTLDDYEEGSWTPNFSFDSGGPATTQGNTSGRYVKIGRQVTCWFYINTSSINSGSGPSYLTGLPFTSSAVIGAAEGATLTCNYWSNFASSVVPGGYVQYNQSRVYMMNLVASTSSQGLTGSAYTNSVNLYGCFTYFTD